MPSIYYDSWISQYWREREEKAVSEDIQRLSSRPDSLAEIERLRAVLAKKQVLKLSDELLGIRQELRVVYGVDSPEQVLINAKTRESRRLVFLLEKYRFLETLKKTRNQHAPHKLEKKPERTSKKRREFASGLNIAKKILQTGKEAIPVILAKTLSGSMSFISYLNKGYDGAKEAFSAYKNEKIKQRKTRLVVGVLTVLLAAGGVGLSVAFLSAVGGAAVAGAPLLPFLMSASLTTIYGMALWRQSYIFHQTKRAEKIAKKEYEEAFVETTEKERHFREKIEEIKRQEHAVEIEFKAVVDKVKSNQPLSPEEEKNHIEYQKKIAAFDEQRLEAEKGVAEAHGFLEARRRVYSSHRKARLRSEREVAFATTEVLSSVLIAASITLGVAAFFGASVATFGAVPLALLITGVVIGVATKVFEHYDNQNNNRYTAGIRNWFSRRLTSEPSKVQETLSDHKTSSLSAHPEHVHESTADVIRFAKLKTEDAEPINKLTVSKEADEFLPAHKPSEIFVPKKPLPEKEDDDGAKDSESDPLSPRKR